MLHHKTHDAPRQQREPLLITDAPCPSSFYSFGAPYPDGVCHDGHMPPYGYDHVVRGDYYSCLTRNGKKLTRREIERRAKAQAT